MTTNTTGLNRRRYGVALGAALVAGLLGATMAMVASTSAGGSKAFSSLVPARLLDTRADGVTIDGIGAALGVRAAGSTTQVEVAGRGGAGADATAVVLNVTATEASGAGYVTVFPCGADRPLASNLNVTSGATVANTVVSKVGAGRNVCVYVSTATQLIVDVNGWFPPGALFSSIVPARLFDSRSGAETVDGAGGGVGVRTARSTSEIVVAGRGGVGNTVGAAVLNVTVTDPSAAGYVTVFPCGADRPLASSLNFTPGSTVANAVVAKIGADGAVCVFVSDATHLVVDVTAAFPRQSSYTSLVPARLRDSRSDGATVDGLAVGDGIRRAGTVTEVQVSGRGGVKRDSTTAVLNVTVTDAAGAGYLTVYPCGAAQPLASSLNFTAGATVANTVITRVSAAGTVCMFVSAATHLIVDVNGFYPALTASGLPPDDTADIPSFDLPTCILQNNGKVIC